MDNERTALDGQPHAFASRSAALDRIRRAVGAATGLPDDVVLTDAQLAAIVERICSAAHSSAIPGLALLARDL